MGSCGGSCEESSWMVELVFWIERWWVVVDDSGSGR